MVRKIANYLAVAMMMLIGGARAIGGALLILRGRNMVPDAWVNTDGIVITAAAHIAINLLGPVAAFLLIFNKPLGYRIGGSFLLLYPLAAAINGPLLYGRMQPVEIGVNIAAAALIGVLLWYGRAARVQSAVWPRNSQVRTR